MKRNTVILLAAFALLLSVACRPRAATLTMPPTPNLLPTPTLMPTAEPIVTEPIIEPVVESTPQSEALPGLEVIGGATAGGFNGTFVGTLVGDGGSSAPATLTLASDGAIVTGAINVGQGLVVDGGNCGQTAVPTGSVSANGQLDPGNPNRLDASSMFNVQGLSIELLLAGELSADGQTLNAQARIDLPLLCGRDPEISGSFVRQ